MFYMIVEGATGERHFGYAHLFRNKTIPQGQFWEEGPAGREMAIFNENGDDYIIINMDPANRYALAASTITRDTITYKGVLYNIQSGVTTDKPLAILGDSGVEGRIHLHLYAYRNIQQALTNFQSIPNCYDPMAVFQLSPRTNFKCRVQNVGVNYGSASKSPFKTRVEMPGAGNGNTYANHMYDVNLVELFVKSTYKDDEPVANWGTTNSSYQYYRGEHTKSVINQGGRPQESSTSMYPISPSDHNIKSSNNGNAQNVSNDTTHHKARSEKDYYWQETDNGIFFTKGFVGIWTERPESELHVEGQILTQALRIGNFEFPRREGTRDQFLRADGVWAVPAGGGGSTGGGYYWQPGAGSNIYFNAGKPNCSK
jgi:hypothetical protein